MRRAFVAVAVAVALAACGSDSPDMSPAAETGLQSEVAAVRAAVDARDDARATAQLASLRTTVASYVGTNLITADRAFAINQAIEQLERQVATRAATTTKAAPAAGG